MKKLNPTDMVCAWVDSLLSNYDTKGIIVAKNKGVSAEIYGRIGVKIRKESNGVYYIIIELWDANKSNDIYFLRTHSCCEDVFKLAGKLFEELPCGNNLDKKETIL